MAKERLYDRDVERALLGGAAVYPMYLDEVLDRVAPTDLYFPAHQHLFTAMRTMRDAGEDVTALTLGEACRASGAFPDDAVLVALITDVFAAATSPRPLIPVVSTLAARRRLALLGEWLRGEAVNHAAAPHDVLNELLARAAAVGSPSFGAPQDAMPIEMFLDGVDDDPRQWVVPGLLRQGWRVMFIAPEGAGKTVVMRQIAACAAQGIHPFSFQDMPPVNALIVDLENPTDAIAETLRPLVSATRSRRAGAYRDAAAWIWHRPGGVNLRSMRDRSELEAVVSHVKPQVVCLGPVYKSYQRKAHESDEDAVGELQAVFDALRARYGFALVLEHHAPKKQGHVRELDPYGTSLWLRWPEMGVKLIPNESFTELTLGRYRPDRVKAVWPELLRRGTNWPWVGRYADGTFG